MDMINFSREITLIGVNFDSEKRNFDEWTAEAFQTEKCIGV